jgi:hypothetical protein
MAPLSLWKTRDPFINTPPIFATLMAAKRYAALTVRLTAEPFYSPPHGTGVTTTGYTCNQTDLIRRLFHHRPYFHAEGSRQERLALN